MSIPFRHGEPVTVVRGGGFDAYGDPTDPTSTHVVEGCAWAPRTQGAGPSSGSVDERGRQGVIVGLTFYAPYDADVIHTDRLVLGQRLTLAEVAGAEMWEVDGEVGRWRSPMTGREHGVEASIRRAEG